MAINLTGTSASFTGTGISSVYSPGFYVNSSDQVKVYVAGVLQSIGDNYTVNNVGVSTGCTVVANFPLGSAVYIERQTPITQLVDTRNNETILEDVLDAEFDKLTMISQEIDALSRDTAARALKLPSGEVASTLPPLTAGGGFLARNPSTGEFYLSSGVGTDAALRGDLGSTAANKGASLVMRKGGGSVEDAMIPDSFTVSLPRNASTLTGTGTSGVAALQALADNSIPEIKLNAFYNLANPTTGATLLDGAVRIPTGESWRGQGIRVKFVIAAADPSPGGYIMLGADAAAQSAQNYDLFPNKSFGGIYLDGRAAAANGKSPVGIVVGGPTWRIHDIYAYQMQTVVRAAEVTGAFGQANAHADHLRITNVHLNAQPNPVDFDPANPANARYGIDFLRALPAADGAEIERCQSNVTGTLGAGAKRCRFIGARGFTNLKVRSTINGDIFFYQCTGTVEECYFESGVVSNMQSDMVVRSCHFFMRNEVTCGADVGAVPVQFLVTPPGVASASANPSSMVLRDCVFNYDAVGSGSTPGNLNGTLGGYTLTNPNFSIGANIYGVMEVENCWRAAPYSNGRGWYQRIGVNCGMADFDNYSHFASLSSRFFGSGSGGSRWEIAAKRGAVSVNSSANASVLESASFDVNFKGPFKGASATYYYRAAALLDKIRGVGILGALEISQAAVNGATGAINLRLGFDLPGGGYMLRLYRGTAAGSYDSYVDVPIIEAGRVYDSGVDVGGYPWISRTAGAADAVNASVSAGIEIGPGEVSAASDAYGRCIAWSYATTMPSVGGWRRGDEVRYATGRWQRLTNCTSTAPAHVVNTDWKQVTY